VVVHLQQEGPKRRRARLGRLSLWSPWSPPTRPRPMTTPSTLAIHRPPAQVDLVPLD
jgi:hypothetical protein